MKKLLFLFLIFPILAFSQQINYTWGQTTAGVAYNQEGVQYCDSARIQIIFDMQDYYPIDFSPLFSDDSVIIQASNLTFLGTFWYYFDAYRATDSTNYYVIAKSGNMIYQPNNASRITATNLFFGADSTIIVTAARAKGDFTGWKFVNVYVNNGLNANAAARKCLPPEFVEVDINWLGGAADSMNVYWNFAYPAVDEGSQNGRSTTRTRGESRKAKPTLH
jgi:hypothetical protein